MADSELPDPDAVEQDETEALAAVEPDLGVEVPEADAIEQAQVVAPVQHRVLHPIRDDVPEADAWEQSVDVALDEDY